MSTKEIYSRVWFETVDAASDFGMDKGDAEAQAVETLMVEVRAGRLEIDVEKALLSEIRKADATHGRHADALLSKIAAGDVPLVFEDFEMVVTLGAGQRKTWYYVRPEDLDVMNEIRYKNFRASRDSFQRFNSDIMAIRPIVHEFETMGAAFEAGAFSKKQAAA
ncbi:hypothetical protein [Leucobacter japonicus]|uniref:hypothetical protein n=1 Tax=Leucobacter japonicus TaxID=1461259 RepID=UPI0006A7C7E6|nr:hypothetical protein [Leucobacter japonicus]